MRGRPNASATSTTFRPSTAAGWCRRRWDASLRRREAPPPARRACPGPDRPARRRPSVSPRAIPAARMVPARHRTAPPRQPPVRVGTRLEWLRNPLGSPQPAAAGRPPARSRQDLHTPPADPRTVALRPNTASEGHRQVGPTGVPHRPGAATRRPALLRPGRSNGAASRRTRRRRQRRR